MGDTEGSTGGLPPVSSPTVRAAAESLADVAIRYVQSPDGRVRVEDYICVLATLTGEAALLSAELFDLETAGLTPGSAVFGDRINEILTGDTDERAKVPEESVAGLLFRGLVPSVAPEDSFGALAGLYTHVAASAGIAEWGHVTLTVGKEHEPGVMPIKAAFDLRPAVDQAQAQAELPLSLRYVPCTLALAHGIEQVRDAMDIRLTIQLALEIVFGMAKMAPMSRTMFEAVAKEQG